MIANYIIIEGGATYKLNVPVENLKIQNPEFRLVCKTNDGAITIQLPIIGEDFDNNYNAKIYIDDIDDNASVNNITIITDPSNSINNSSQYIVSKNGDKVEIFISNKNEYGVLDVPSAVTPILFTPKIIYVDDINGNDATGEVGYPTKPFATIDSATNIANNGDTIIATRGTYYISNPFKPNVVYDLGTSDIFGYTNIITSTYGSGIFKIYGKSNIVNYGNLISSISNSDVYVECNSIRYYSTVVGGSIFDSNIIIKTELTESLNNGAFHTYLEGDSINVNINFYSVKYLLHRGFISWFNGNNTININVYGTYLLHNGLDYYASLAWLLGDGMTINFYVNNIEISANSANSFFPWYGVLNVYSKIKCITDTSWIMADGGKSTFYGDINAPLGLLFVRGGANATVVLKELTLTSNRGGNSTIVNGNLFLYSSDIKSTDIATVLPIVALSSATSNLMLNNSKIIGDNTKPSIEDTSGTPNLVQVYGSCYTVTPPINITQAPETIIQYPTLQ